LLLVLTVRVGRVAAFFAVPALARARVGATFLTAPAFLPTAAADLVDRGADLLVDGAALLVGDAFRLAAVRAVDGRTDGVDRVAAALAGGADRRGAARRANDITPGPGIKLVSSPVSQSTVTIWPLTAVTRPERVPPFLDATSTLWPTSAILHLLGELGRQYGPCRPRAIVAGMAGVGIGDR
jgi:hypothetical protein